MGQGLAHDFRELILKHKGKRFVVMGGGPSLAADLERIGPAGVVISTNGHGVGLRKPDTSVACRGGLDSETGELNGRRRHYPEQNGVRLGHGAPILEADLQIDTMPVVDGVDEG